MTSLHSLEGIEGYRWGLYFRKDGGVERSSQAPPADSPQCPQMRQFLDLLPEDMDAADLVFDLGRILIRSGAGGQLLLVCDRVIKMTAVNLMVTDLLKAENAKISSTSLGDTDSQISMVHTLSFGEKEVPAPVISELLDLFTQVLGPLAPRLASMIARKRSIDLDHVQEKDWSLLLNALAAQIDLEDKREKFLDTAVTLKNNF